MRDSCTPLYPNDQVAAKVTEYAEKHSSPIPQHMRDVHAYTSANDPDHANFMISTLQAQFQIWMAKALGSKRSRSTLGISMYCLLSDAFL